MSNHVARPGPAHASLREGFALADRTVLPLLLRVETPRGEERIEPQVLGVLLLLAERAGETVTRAEIFERVWEGRFVSEDVLHRAISRLRALFDDDARVPRVIQTIPKVGYRLLVQPSALAVAPVPAAPPAPAASAAVGRPARGTALAAVACALLLAFGTLEMFARRESGPAPVPAGKPLPLLSLPGVELQPAFSPGGRDLAFSWDGEDGTRRLYYQRSGEGTPRRLTASEGKDGAPAFSPGGGHVAFVRLLPEGCRILRLDLASGAEEQVGRCGSVSFVRLDFSPDGRSLVFSDAPDGGDNRHAIWAIDLASGVRRRVTEPPPGAEEDVYPSVSPDGARVAFARGAPGSARELFVAGLGGGPARQLTFDGASIYGVDWIDAESLVVATTRGGGAEAGLWRIGLSGSAVPLALAGDLRAPIALDGGRRFVFESWREHSHLVTARVSGETSPAIGATGASSRSDHSPALSPNGLHLAFVSDREGSPQLFLAHADGTSLRRVTSFPGSLVSRPVFSPDGALLAFEKREGARTDVCTVEPSGAGLRCFDDPAGQDVAPRFTADGRSLYFGSDRTGRFEIWRRDLGGSAPVQVTSEGGYWPKAEVDGSLYFLRFRQPGLHRRDALGRERLVLADPSHTMASTVRVSPQGVHWAEPDGTVHLASLDGASRKRVGQFPGLHVRSGLELLPRSRPHFLYALGSKPDVEILTLGNPPAG